MCVCLMLLLTAELISNREHGKLANWVSCYGNTPVGCTASCGYDINNWHCVYSCWGGAS